MCATALSAVTASALPGFDLDRIVVDGQTMYIGASSTVMCSGGGSASYDDLTRTLTLTDAVINNYITDNGSEPAGIYIYSSFDIKIKIVGNCQISLTGTEESSYGIYFKESSMIGTADIPKLTIEGDGADRSSLEIITYSDSRENSFGIFCEGSIDLDSLSLDISLANGSSNMGSAIRSVNDDISLEHTKLVSKPASDTAPKFAEGLYAANGYVTVSDSSDITINCLNECLYAHQGAEINISNSKATLKATGFYGTPLSSIGNIDLTNAEVDALSTNFRVVYANGNMTVSGGRQKFETESNTNLAISVVGDLSIKNGADMTVISKNSSAVFARSNLEIIASKLTAKSLGNNSAIKFEKTVHAESMPSDAYAPLILGEDIHEKNGAILNVTDWELFNDYILLRLVAAPGSPEIGNGGSFLPRQNSYRSTAAFTGRDGAPANELIFIGLTYDIKYLPGVNGTGDAVTDIKDKDTPITFKDALFTRTGFTQVGWALNDGASDSDYAFGTAYSVNADLTLYPVWKDTEKPFVTGLENNKTYCGSVNFEATDNVAVTAVTAGNSTLSVGDDGKYTLVSGAGKVTVVAVDAVGNRSEEYVITVNSGHTGGKPTCKSKPKCEVCGEEYGEKNPENHGSLTHVEGNPATESADGNREYWHCEDCGKYFLDEDEKNEATLADTVIPKLNKKSPKTGDSTSLSAWTAVFCLGALGFGTGYIFKKKKLFLKNK